MRDLPGRQEGRRWRDFARAISRELGGFPSALVSTWGDEDRASVQLSSTRSGESISASCACAFRTPPRPSRSITSETKSWATSLNEPLKTTDPDLHAIIEQEKVRQRESLVLIASENFTSR